MTQDEILKFIKECPGITQLEIYKKTDISVASSAQQILSMKRKGIVARKAIKRTYELYPIVETPETVYCIIRN